MINILADLAKKCAFIGVVAVAAEARGDALVVTKAMQATTIAEVFIGAGQIRAEIEIGQADIPAFGNIYPDELFQKLTDQTKPLSDRQQTFFDSDWVIRVDGQALQGTPTRIVVDKRVARDEITGEPLAEQPAAAELVIRLSLQYTLDGHPGTLTIRPPARDGATQANIGFVCYHNGLPVNDFRYLPGEVTLDLDWEDPWYSRFRHPNFTRQFDAPLSAFLYVEPFEVRQEIVVRPVDLQNWIDLGLGDDATISVAHQNEIKQRVAEFLAERNPVTIDGELAAGRLDRVHFIRRTLRSTGIIEPPVDLDATSATLGVIFVYPVERLPQNVAMEWELFAPKIQQVPVVAADEAGGLPGEVTPNDPLLEWKNYLTNPTIPQMLAIVRPPASRKMTVPIASVLSGGVAMGAFFVSLKRKKTGKNVSRTALAIGAVATIVAAITVPYTQVSIANPFDRPTPLDTESSKELLNGLLHNVYRSFDHHDESLIYDQLARSISGEMLRNVYLQTRKNMEIKNQGGLRVSVKELNVTDIEMVDGTAMQPTYRCRWRVAGWIGHWGHIHRRENEHAALITLSVREGMWKIVGMEIFDEQPVAQEQQSPSRQGRAG